MCIAGSLSMKAHDSWSVALSRVLKLCELVLIWCFPVISISFACWELCFVFPSSTWNSLNWQLITSTVCILLGGVKVGSMASKQEQNKLALNRNYIVKDINTEESRDFVDKKFLVCFIVKQSTSLSNCRWQIKMTTLGNFIDMGGRDDREKSFSFMCSHMYLWD